MDDSDKRLRLYTLCGGVLRLCCRPLPLTDGLARCKVAREVAAVLSASGPCDREVTCGMGSGLAPTPLVSSMTTNDCVPLTPNEPSVAPTVRSCGTNAAPAVMGATITFGDAEGGALEATVVAPVGDSKLRDEPAPPREPERGSGGLSLLGEISRDVGHITGTSPRVGENKSRLRCTDSSWSELARRKRRRGGV